MILPDVRASFGRQEASMLLTLLNRREPDRTADREAAVAERGLDVLLDDPGALEAIRSDPGISTLPDTVVMYVLLRHTLLEAGISDRLLADYMASLVLRFGRAGRAYRPATHDDCEYHYLVDILADLEDADGRRACLLAAHLGNFALWLSGLFPDHITHRMHRRGGPGIDYYESLGETGFRRAASDPFARTHELDGLFVNVATGFPRLRRALNRFSDRYLLPRATSPDDRLLRQVADEVEDRWLQA